MDERICATCHGRVSPIDPACPHCGALFNRTLPRTGSFLNDFFRLALGLWVLLLPAYCLWLLYRYEGAFGEFAAYLASHIFFIPWLVGVISLGVLTWLTEQRS